MENEKSLEKTIKDPLVLKVPWCPLLGILPHVKNIPNSIQFQLVDIIVRARQLWDVEVHEIYDTDLDQTIFSCKFRKEDYPNRKILTARTIYTCYESVSQHMIDGFFRTTSGRVIEKHNLSTKWSEACYFIRCFHYGMTFDIDTEDYEILAILAISIAHWRLNDLTDADDLVLVEYVLEAQGLLMVAAEQKRKALHRIAGESRGKEFHDLLKLMKDEKTKDFSKTKKRTLAGEIAAELLETPEKYSVKIQHVINKYQGAPITLRDTIYSFLWPRRKKN